MSKRTFTDIPDPWAGRLAVASAPQWWEPPAAPRLRPHTEILDSLAPLVFDLLAAGWDEGKHSDRTCPNPYRQTDPEGDCHE